MALLLLSASPAWAQAPAGAKPEDKPAPVVVQEATLDEFTDSVQSIGTLRANETITVASTVTETVTAVNFTDGQRVSKGDVLIEMTSGEERALIEQQKSTVAEARKQFDRAKALSKDGTVSAAILDQREREYSTAVSGMLALQSRLNDHIIVAPFDGVLGIRNISVGALLQPGMKITTLDDDSVMKLDFSVPSLFLPTLVPGLKIKARANGFDEVFEGSVSAIDSQVNETTRTVMVRSLIDNPDRKLKPGLLMTIELFKNPRRTIVIPEMAIIPEGRKTFVLVIDEGKVPAVAEKREIKAGQRRPGEIEVLEGLKAGDKVVVYGTMTTRNGQAVNVQAVRQKNEKLEDVLKRIKAAAVTPSEK